jgi:hypothetical protein
MGIPISTEARGKLRLWRREVAERQGALDRVLERKPFRLLVDDFLYRGSEKGRLRALMKLRQKLDPVTAGARVARLHGKAAAMWAAISVSEDGAAVDYLVIDAVGKISRGPWNIRASDHALARFYQRSPRGADLTAALLGANVNVGRGKLYQLPKDEGVLVAAGDGAFRGRVDPGGFDHFGLANAWSWLHSDQLFEDQENQLAAGLDRPLAQQTSVTFNA